MFVVWNQPDDALTEGRTLPSVSHHHFRKKTLAINPNQVFKRLKSDNENERIVASQKLYDMFTKDGGHPDDWEIKKKGDSTAAERMAQRAQAVAAMLEEELKKQRAAAEKERKAHAKTEEMLQEQLRQARAFAASAAAPDDEWADFADCLLSQATVDEMTAEQIKAKMIDLFAEGDRRQHNATAEVDLVIGQLTAALYRCHEQLYGRQRRGSNAPAIGEFLEQYAGKSASWCRRCYKAYSIFVSPDWSPEDWDRSGGIEGIIKSVSDRNKPKAKRVNKLKEKLDALTAMVRKKQWEYAERMVNDWDNAVS